VIVTKHPIIGISSYAQQARWGAWDLPAILLPARYVDMVSRAGGVPVLVPPVHNVAEVLQRLDGLVLSGGGDIDPALYGATRDPATGPANPGRDLAELELCRGALGSGMPLLGICRGLQILNVAVGGTLHQHLPDVVGTDMHSPEQSGYGRHDVSVAPGTQLAKIVGGTEVAVPTHHHQAIDKLARGLVATAWTSDGIIEAVEFESGDRPAIAVQWHPEAGDDISLFDALVSSCQPGRS